MKRYVSIVTILFFLLSFSVCFAINPQESADTMKNLTAEFSGFSGHTSEATEEPTAIGTDEEPLPSDELPDTETPEPTKDSQEADDPGQISEPLETMTPEPTNVLEVIETPEPPDHVPLETPEPEPTVEPLETLTPEPTNMLEVIETPEPSDHVPTETPEPEPTVEPLETMTPEPTNILEGIETPEPPEELQLEQVHILEILSVADELTFLQVGESISETEFPKTTYIQTGPRDFLECEILWEDVSIIDTSVPGRTSLRGKLLPPEGYCFAKASEPYVEIPYLFFNPGGEPTESAYPVENTSDTILIMPGSNPGDFINYDNKVPFKTSHGDFFYCRVEWDGFEVVQSEGPFSVQGRYLLPEGICLKDGISPYYNQDFFVMKDDTIYLDFMKIQNGSIICTWLKEVEDSDDITAYYAIKDDGWQIDENEQYGFVLSNAFVIPTTTLSPDTDYYFKLEYQGQVTKTLHINICEDQIKSDFVEGDRDGGDNAEQEIPPLTQPRGGSSSSSSKRRSNRPSGEKTIITNPQLPEPIIPETQMELPDESGSNFQVDEIDEANIMPSALLENQPNIEERVTDTKTIMTGERLEQMMEVQGGSPSIEKGGVVLELPEDFTEKNSITNNDKISIQIDKKPNEIAVSVEINDNQVSDITGAKIRIPDNNAVLKKDEKEIPPISSRDSNTVFQIDETGIYNTIDSAGSEEKSFPYALWLGIGIFAICLIILAVRRVSHYRK